MFLITGLGNPGIEYVRTRHNAGFLAVDEIAQAYGFSAFKDKFDGLVAEGKIQGEKVLLLKPQTFMNLSGNSVLKAAHFYKVLPENIIVIHDDIDLKIDQVRAKIGGGNAGHNGLKSIDAHIGQAYNRIRIGVGSAEGRKETVDHVLSGFSKADEKTLARNIEIVSKLIGVLIKDGIEKFSTELGMAVKD